jgi:MFS family permease
VFCIDSELRFARLAVSAVFFVNGALFANWVARVPAVKDAVGAGTGALGVALLGIAVGSLLTMPMAGRWCDRYGSGRVVLVTGLATALALQAPAHVQRPVTLGLALVLYGAAFGALDVAMNVQAVAVVRRLERPIMPWFHAAFSLGGLTGALVGAGAAGVGVSPAWHFALVTVATAAVVLAARPHLLPPEPAQHDRTDAPVVGRRRRRVPLLLVGLGAIAASAAVGEGGMADWAALFLRDVRDTGAGFAALGYAAFSVAMTAGRLGGEKAIGRFGPMRVLRYGGLAAASGIVATVVVPSPVVALVGFALVGIGFSCAFPVALTTAGESGTGSGGSEIATVSVIGYLGFLAGPPLIGLLAEVVGLRGAMLAIAAAGVGLAALGSTVRDLPVAGVEHGLHVDDRCAVDGLQVGDAQPAALDLEDADAVDAHRVRTVG